MNKNVTIRLDDSMLNHITMNGRIKINHAIKECLESYINEKRDILSGLSSYIGTDYFFYLCELMKDKRKIEFKEDLLSSLYSDRNIYLIKKIDVLSLIKIIEDMPIVFFRQLRVLLKIFISLSEEERAKYYEYRNSLPLFFDLITLNYRVIY